MSNQPVNHQRAFPQPPSHLTRGAADVWIQLATSQTPGFWSRADLPVLETLSVALVEYRRVAAAVAETDPAGDLAGYCRLGKMLDTLAARIGSASTRLRLTPQARVDKRQAGRSRGSQLSGVVASIGGGGNGV